LHISDGKCQIPESATGAAFDAALAALRFPSTVEGVITSRLDRLSAELQLTVKVASVIGQRFSESALHAVHPVASDRPHITAHLAQAERLKLIHRFPDDENQYVFRQAITQDVAYQSIPFAQRRPLHRSVGEWLEREFGAALPA